MSREAPRRPALGELVEAFRLLLASQWDTMHRLAASVPTGSYLQDWLQASWETVVEGGLSGGREPVYLEVYDEGADCNGASSRVWRPEALPTHHVACVPAGGCSVVARDPSRGREVALPLEGLPFDRFAHVTEGQCVEGPPFQFAVLLGSEGELVVPLAEVTFELREGATWR